MRPIIGLAGVCEPAAWSVWKMEAVLAPANYVKAVQRAGGLAVIIPIDDAKEQTAQEILSRIDGLMLLGGVDVHPSNYGEEPHPTTTDSIIQRDQFELALLHEAIRADKPTLAICRGMQLLNIAFGGTLTQHLPDQLGHNEHRRHLGTFENIDHDVKPIAGSTLVEITGSQPFSVKSHHHQGISKLGNGLKATAKATSDDLIEAIELPAKNFVLGVQWHPEAEERSRVIDAFVSAAMR